MPIGPITEMQLRDPMFSNLMWKLTPASLAVRLSNGRFKTWPYVQLLSRKLVDVAMGKCTRLIICMPPRHGKSELTSWWFPTWYLENFQDRKIILASYEMDFASKWGAKVRDTLMDNQSLLNLRFTTKNPAMHYFETTEGGIMSCAGVGGSITGKGANILIIDDYVKNAEEASSPTIREKTWDWWTSTARTRVEPFMGNHGEKVQPSVIVIATRWHSDDLIGRLINPDFFNEKGQREEWEVFVFPAAAEPEAEEYYRKFGVKVNDLRLGSVVEHKKLSVQEQLARINDPEWRDVLGRKRGEPLCPDRYNELDLAMFRGTSMRDWLALYQQRPGDEAEDGNVYHEFDAGTHCQSTFRNEHMQLFVSMDFNVDPMCAVIGQYDRGNGDRILQRCEVLEEIILRDSNTPNMMMRLIKELKKYQWGYTLSVEIYGDAAGTQRSSQSQKTNWQIVSEYLSLEPNIHFRFVRHKANPTIVDRVNAVNMMLRAADGSTRLYFDDFKCFELVQDMKKVKWQTDTNGNSTGLLDKRDKDRTHISDALGYMVEYNFGLKMKAGAGRGFMQ